MKALIHYIIFIWILKISTVSLKVITAHVRVTKWTCTNSVSPNCSGYKLKIGYAKVKGCTIVTDSIKTFTQNENEETFPLSSKNGTTFTFIPKNTSNERLIVVVVDDRDNFQATTCEDLHKRHEQGNKTFIHTDAYFALGSAKYSFDIEIITICSSTLCTGLSCNHCVKIPVKTVVSRLTALNTINSIYGEHPVCPSESFFCPCLLVGMSISRETVTTTEQTSEPSPTTMPTTTPSTKTTTPSTKTTTSSTKTTTHRTTIAVITNTDPGEKTGTNTTIIALIVVIIALVLVLVIFVYKWWTRNNQVNDYYTSSKIKKELSDHSERKEEHTVNKKKKKKRKKECDSETKSNTPNVKTEGKQGSHEHADQTRQSNSNKSKNEENVSKTNGNESLNKDEITPLEYQCEVSKIDENTPSKKSKCKKDKKKFDKDEQDKQKDNENNSMEAQIEHHNEQSKHNESQASEEVLSGRCKYIPVAEKGDCSVENKNDESRLERSKSVIDENANSIRKLEMRNTDSENKRSKSARASNSKNKRSPNTRLHLQNFTGSSEEAVLCVAIS